MYDISFFTLPFYILHYFNSFSNNLITCLNDTYLNNVTCLDVQDQLFIYKPLQSLFELNQHQI